MKKELKILLISTGLVSLLVNCAGCRSFEFKFGSPASNESNLNHYSNKFNVEEYKFCNR